MDLPSDSACEMGCRFKRDSIYFVIDDALSVTFYDPPRKSLVPVGSFRWTTAAVGWTTTRSGSPDSEPPSRRSAIATFHSFSRSFSVPRRDSISSSRPMRAISSAFATTKTRDAPASARRSSSGRARGCGSSATGPWMDRRSKHSRKRWRRRVCGSRIARSRTSSSTACATRARAGAFQDWEAHHSTSDTPCEPNRPISRS